MNVQTHISGQISGNVPNQPGTQLPGLPMNGNNLAPQMQRIGGQINNMDSEIAQSRRFVMEKIYEILILRHQQPVNDGQKRKFRDIVKRLEEGLFKSAHTREEYSNMETLESRLHHLIKRQPVNNQNQQYSQIPNNNQSSIGAMIPTPGMSHSGNSNMMVTSSVDTSMISSSGGPMSNGYQPSANFSVGPGGTMPSMNAQRMPSQMIPTPGFSSNANQSYMNLESSSNNGGYSTTESTMISQPQLQKQPIGGQNSRILHSLGGQMGSGIRSTMQQKPYGFSNGAINGGLGLIGNNSPHVNEHGMSEGYMTGTSFVNSSKPLQHQYDQQQRVMQGDAYGMGNVDAFGSGNNGSATSVGATMNTQNMNSVTLSPTAKTSSSILGNQPNMQTQHVANSKPQPDQIENMSYQSSLSTRENIIRPHQFQHQPQFANNQRSLKLQNQQPQHLLNNDMFGQSQLTSGISSHVNVKRETVEHHNEILHSQMPEHFQLTEMQNQFQTSMGSSLRGGQHFSLQSGHQDCASLSQTSQSLQQPSNPPEFKAVPQNDFSCVSVGGQSESVLQGQWNTQNTNVGPGNVSHEKHLQEDFHQRISGQGEAQRNNLSSEGSLVAQAVASRSASTCKSNNLSRETQHYNQQRWLLLVRHAHRCLQSAEGRCVEHCRAVQGLCKHIQSCQINEQCGYPRCFRTKKLLNHSKCCRNPLCPVCIPVNKYIYKHRVNRLPPNASLRGSLSGSVSGSSKPFDNGHSFATSVPKASPMIEPLEDIPVSNKRIKMEQSSQSLLPDSQNTTSVLVPSIDEVQSVQNFKHQGQVLQNVKHQGQVLQHVKHQGQILQNVKHQGQVSQNIKHQELPKSEIGLPINSEFTKVEPEVPVSAPESFVSLQKDVLINAHQDLDKPIVHDNSVGIAPKEEVKVEKEIEPVKQENVTQPVEPERGTKSGKPKIKGVSLTELFTPEQVREHIFGLRQWVGQSKAKVEKNQAMEQSMSENSCQLCAVEKLTFEPPPIYCSPCGARIKRNAMYYSMGAGDTRHYFCIPCYNEARGDTIVVDGTVIPKHKLDKKKNDEETEEWWVQCDKCEAWQHQICALFNGRRNDGGQAEYTCPNCYIQEVERGERKPLPQSAVLGAKDLPKTILSDQIEQRLFKKLKQERLDRAKAQGKTYDQVPGAESLVIRVVSSVDKKLEVKQRFLEIFQEENYPTEFPYKSKVVLLFQKIEGVEVCLFGMYVQEFGSEAQYPNQRRVYLSYLDSVKYFRPEIKSVNGEALRTYVYHEILIGYLEYCKNRGFTSCYIWACPPLKGEDYILYCHPEIQKTPKSDKLREWYLAMLRKAAKENIVVDLTNLYDHFFISNGECKAKVTAARLPYFDGDYWPGAAEDLIYQLRQEEDGRKHNKKGTMKKTTITKRALKASGQSDLSGNASKDLLLMHKLGETISPMKEDFIMVHLQHSCNHCCNLMVSGNRWVCDNCKKFQLCDKCYELELKCDERERHPVNMRDKHSFHPVEIDEVPVDTKDKDEILESEFFDTRQAFLSLCQGNHYQYDTLRRAKHSSMMVLYHLHNPTAPAFVTTCNMCHLDIESGQGWRCDICSDYDVCNACYQKDGNSQHPHKLTNHPSVADRDAQNQEARQMRVQQVNKQLKFLYPKNDVQLRKMLDLLVHASVCRSAQCHYPNCRKVKGLFRHGIQCKTRASGGCVLCKRMWYLLQLHARACKESECHVPRCRDLKEHLRRLQQQADSRRRAAVMEMMRQRAAELTSNTG